MSGRLTATLVLALALGLVSGHPNSSRPNTDPLIVGGVDATPGEFPYIVHLNIGCGGSLIDSRWILTAAHCAVYPANLYTVVAGEHNLAKEEGTEVTVGVSRIVIYPGHDDVKHVNDIALMELDQELVLKDRVQLVALPARNFSPVGNSTTAGWGTLTQGGSTPDILQKVSVPLVSLADCKEAYRDLVETGQVSYTVDESNVCAGVGGKDSCQGDSGGPLLCDGLSGPYLCGVVSKGYGCAVDGFPGVYAKTDVFLDWIDETLASNKI